mgnify:CR=1 FL=1
MKLHKFHAAEISLFTFRPVAGVSSPVQVARLADKISSCSLGMETIAIDTTKDDLEVLAPSELAQCLLDVAVPLGFTVSSNAPPSRLYGDVLHGHVELLHSAIDGVVWLVTF